MQTKLTLRLESGLIEQAKFFASQQDKSLSQMVADYFQALTQPTNNADLPPVTRSLTGVLSGHQLDRNDYHRRLEEKYF